MSANSHETVAFITRNQTLTVNQDMVGIASDTIAACGAVTGKTAGVTDNAFSTAELRRGNTI